MPVATLLYWAASGRSRAAWIWQHARDMEYAGAAPFALLLILLSGVPVYLLMRGRYAVSASSGLE